VSSSMSVSLAETYTDESEITVTTAAVPAPVPETAVVDHGGVGDERNLHQVCLARFSMLSATS
jgi:hypothetical protein